MSVYISLDQWRQNQKQQQQQQKSVKALVAFYPERPMDVIKACHATFGKELFTHYLQTYLQRYSVQHAIVASIQKCVEFQRRAA